jgi:RND family efflux transporter MFP subunit
MLLPWVLTACGHSSTPDPRTAAPLVRIAVAQEAASGSRSFSGTVAARVQSDLGFRVAGKVLQRLVDTGDVVKRGQPLLRIDPIDLGLLAHAGQEAVAGARAVAEQTAQDELRYRDLAEAGAVSASFYEQIKARAETAQAQLSAAQAQSQVADNSSRYAVLVADADGIVIDTLVEPGQVVAAGQVVARVAHAGPREAIVQLPETLHPAVGSAGRATLFGAEGLQAATRLRQLSGAADRVTRTFEARYVLEGALANAPIGATVRIELPQAGSSNSKAVQVPVGAIFDPGTGPGVWVVAGDPAAVTWRPVVLGSVSDEAARLYSGVAAGERVVSLGAHLLQNGQVVRTAIEAPQTVALAAPEVRP